MCDIRSKLRDMTADLYGLLYLVSCEVKGRVASVVRINDMDLCGVLRQANRHKLESILLSALKKAYGGALPQSERFSECIFAAELAEYTRKALFAERDELFRFMEDAGIWYMPIKGEEIGRFYPNPALRQTADCDILFDVDRREDIKRYFTRRGFCVAAYKKGAHDVYKKPPFFNFELHISFFDGVFPQLASYFKDVKSRLVRCENSGFRYRFTDKDFYVYFVAHAFKHFSGGGTGLRTLLDVFYVNEGLRFDKAAALCELEDIGCAEFEREISALAYKLFKSGERLNAKERTMLEQALCAGAYGDKAIFAKNGVERAGGGKVCAKGKRRYILRRLFPDKTAICIWCEYNAPHLYKHPRLIFLAYFKRLFRAMFLKFPSAFRELFIVFKLK